MSGTASAVGHTSADGGPDVRAPDRSGPSRPYLEEVLDLLYPTAIVEVGGALPDPATGAVVASFIVMPCVLVPAANRRIAAAAAPHYESTGRAGRTGRWQRRAAVAALRTRTDRMLLRDRITVRVPWEEQIDSIEAYLAAALGVDDGIAIAVHIGPEGSGRTPVVQVLDASGTTLGYAKLGIGALPADLVHNETDALERLYAPVREGALGALTVPRKLHSGQWRGIDLLVESALPMPSKRTKLTSRRLSTAMCQVATCAGVTTATLAAGWYWRRLKARIDRICVPASGMRPDADQLVWGRALGLAADQLVATSGGVRLRHGAWHGDWTPQHMATGPTSLLLWGWERFAVGVPLGFDALHFHLMRLLDRGASAQHAVTTTLARAERLLAPFEVVPEATTPTALLYLIELAVRYLEDGEAGGFAHALLPVVTDAVS